MKMSKITEPHNYKCSWISFFRVQKTPSQPNPAFTKTRQFFFVSLDCISIFCFRNDPHTYLKPLWPHMSTFYRADIIREITTGNMANDLHQLFKMSNSNVSFLCRSLGQGGTITMSIHPFCRNPTFSAAPSLHRIFRGLTEPRLFRAVSVIQNCRATSSCAWRHCSWLFCQSFFILNLRFNSIAGIRWTPGWQSLSPRNGLGNQQTPLTSKAIRQDERTFKNEI